MILTFPAQRFLTIAWEERLWIGIAVGGSLFYGATLAFIWELKDLLFYSLWFTISAGGAWAALIPALAAILDFEKASRVCVRTMAVGEAILVPGACIHLFLPTDQAEIMVAFTILGSNIAMQAYFIYATLQHRITPFVSVGLWNFILNGVGAILFTAIYFLRI